MSLLTLMVVLLPRVAMAQTDATSTRVKGTVKDLNGGVSPDASIEVKSLHKPHEGGS